MYLQIWERQQAFSISDYFDPTNISEYALKTKMFADSVICVEQEFDFFLSFDSPYSFHVHPIFIPFDLHLHLYILIF